MNVVEHRDSSVNVVGHRKTLVNVVKPLVNVAGYRIVRRVVGVCFTVSSTVECL